MIILDTSVWINHIAKPSVQVIELLESNQVITHPVVIGELSCGNFKKRAEFLSNLKLLERAIDVPGDEILTMIEKHKLYGLGLGWMDCQLLASALVDRVGLLTADKALRAACIKLGVPSA